MATAPAPVRSVASDGAAGLDTAALTPAQRRTWNELLAARQPRPPIDPLAAERWRTVLERRLAPVVDTLPSQAPPLWVSKGKLDALSCEGRFLDQQATPFAWSLPSVLGTVAHRAVEIDLAGRRRRDLTEVVAQAIADLSAADSAAGVFIAQLSGPETDSLAGQSAARVAEFREVFPLLPAAWVRTEVSLRARLVGGRVVLGGRPDVVVGRSHPRRRQQLLIDLKSGARHPRHAADMRLYALLALLKYRAAPFRVATFYLDEADWEVETVTDAVLEDAVETVVAGAAAAARLTFDPPPATELRLQPGPACGWCSRAPSCPALLGAGAQREREQPRPVRAA